MAKKHCPHCNAPMVEYNHTLSRGLLGALRKVAQAGPGTHHVPSLGLTHSQQCNWPKLAYWELVERDFDEGGAKGGYWSITDAGWRFLRGESMAASRVTTYRNTVVAYPGAQVHVFDVLDGWKYRPDYAEDSQPGGNGDLFDD